MTLNDVVNQLKYGELRSIATKDDNAAIISYVNLALQALYNRFTLKVSEQIIPLQDNVVEYTLNPDLMVIEGIYDENGDEFELDDPTSLFSIMQVDFETIQIANPANGATLSVIYKPAPTTLTYVDETSLTQKIPIPPQLTEPLLHYIGYRAHGSMDGNIKAENNTHYMRFVASCDKIEQLGLVRKAVVPAHVSQAEGISEINITYEEVDMNNRIRN
jgi:hypothetical protein